MQIQVFLTKNLSIFYKNMANKINKLLLNNIYLLLKCQNIIHMIKIKC